MKIAIVNPRVVHNESLVVFASELSRQGKSITLFCEMQEGVDISGGHEYDICWIDSTSDVQYSNEVYREIIRGGYSVAVCSNLGHTSFDLQVLSDIPVCVVYKNPTDTAYFMRLMHDRYEISEYRAKNKIILQAESIITHKITSANFLRSLGLKVSYVRPGLSAVKKGITHTKSVCLVQRGEKLTRDESRILRNGKVDTTFSKDVIPYLMREYKVIIVTDPDAARQYASLGSSILLVYSEEQSLAPVVKLPITKLLNEYLESIDDKIDELCRQYTDGVLDTKKLEDVASTIEANSWGESLREFDRILNGTIDIAIEKGKSVTW